MIRALGAKSFALLKAWSGSFSFSSANEQQLYFEQLLVVVVSVNGLRVGKALTRSLEAIAMQFKSLRQLFQGGRRFFQVMKCPLQFYSNNPGTC